MDYVTMNEQFGKDLKEFECKFKEFSKRRKIAYSTLSMIIGIFIGISIVLYLSNSYPINNLTLTIDAIVISVFIGTVSWVLGWDTRRRGDLGMEYSEFRFNYVMQFIKIVDDNVSSLKKILEDCISALKKP